MSYFVQLRTFVEVYRCGTITKAAANLGLSQPAATAHIQSIESWVGFALFERKARGVEPTVAAHDLALQVARHFDAVEQKLASVRNRNSAVYGTLNIAGPAEYISYIAGAQFANLLQAGEVNLVVHVGNKDRIYQLLAEGTAELAITASTPDPALYDYQIIDSERLILVTNRFNGQQLAQQTLSSEQLRLYPVVSYDETLPLIRPYFKTVFNDSCLSPIAAICPDIRAIAGIIKAGIGYSVLPDYLCKEAITAGELMQLGPEGPENFIYLVWRKGALKHPRISYAKDILMAFANINKYAHQKANS
ncbi:LysR family transcriptional regulator [Alishewanella sp. 16-MA]|uniref:LysR family transcriptional regulator n=1 Tax=Alishewanella maricola TaxID=2795740 RepID=A0ABS8C3N6_9ALTE|nr:LysR family transcriptional regulator [Alishewanella maricola]MCB5226952.1 LysR family transcriptional regulator [Alishewanella maricola]